MDLAALGDANSTAASAQRKKSDVDQKREAAVEFEAVFAAEMLAHAGLGEALAGESGHAGETFSGFLLEAYARKIAERGSLGLAERIFERLPNDGVSDE